MRIIYATGHQPSRSAPSAAVAPGPGERRVPVVVIRTGTEGPGSHAPNATDAPTPADAAGGPRSQDRSPGIDIAGTDYRLTLSDEALQRDQAVRTHEGAHMAALGGYATTGIIYDTRTGPGGKTVAVGGRIGVDLSEVPGDPRATLRKARTIYAAATAPGDPSAADMRVAAEAYRLMRDARSELSTERTA